MRITFIAFAVALAFGSTASADDSPRTIPVSYEWVVVPCENWNAAMAAMLLADGDPYVVAVPTTDPGHRWIVLKRVVSGAYVPPPDMPWTVEAFDGPHDASNRMSALAKNQCALLVTTNDARAVLVYLRDPDARTRSVRH